MESAVVSSVVPSGSVPRVQVLGADADPVSPADLARLFPRLRPFSPASTASGTPPGSR